MPTTPTYDRIAAEALHRHPSAPLARLRVGAAIRARLFAIAHGDDAVVLDGEATAARAAIGALSAATLAELSRELTFDNELALAA